MNTRKLKEGYERFKRWMAMPYDYEFAPDDVHRCNNCGHQFAGNFCPHCSQKADEGPVGWDSVRRDVMNIWGLGSRSLLVTLLQLLVRPGHLIGDYISGKRQVSFPPVKMLFIIALLVAFWIYYLLPTLLGDGFDVYGGNADLLVGFAAWNKTHFAWTYLALAFMYIVPTWVMFRHSPLHTRHTLPEGFFIQVFLLVLNMVVSFLALSPLAVMDYGIYQYVSYVVLWIYYTVAYKQLFGYGLWGTMWRLAFVLGSSIYLISSLAFLIFDVDTTTLGEMSSTMTANKYFFFGVSACMAALILTAGWAINLLATRKSRKNPE